MRAGRLDRRITFERRVETGRSAYNKPVYAWHPHATVWAQVQDVLPSRAESVDDAISMQRRPCRIRMRWRDDITSDMRIVFDGRTLRIVSGPAEMGRREGLELVAEELSTEGEAP